MTFENLNLIEPILKALKAEGYTTPTPIQQQAIPLLLERKDLLGCAQTGTGKTAAFAIPMIQLMVQDKSNVQGKKHIRGLVLTPTRELAIQIEESFANYGKNTPLKYRVIFGGVNQFSQVQAIKAGVDILIATPGRLLDLMNQRLVDISKIEFFVLDEADRMLDMGFVHDVKRIITKLPAKRQSLFFSATMPPAIKKFAQQLLHDPAEIAIAISKPAAGVTQLAYSVYDGQKNELIKSILKEKTYSSILIFSSTKEKVRILNRELNQAGLRSKAIHSGLEQE
jgi:ATP-dependent RNA helicase RhlE